MFGLAAIGVSMTLGIFMRPGTIAGVAMYLLMWSVVLPPDNIPIIDDHVLGAAARGPIRKMLAFRRHHRADRSRDLAVHRLAVGRFRLQLP